MSLTSEMSRITAEFEAAQGERLAAVAKIGSDMRRESRRNAAFLRRTMTTHRAAIKGSLRDIFGTAAFARGAADEMVDHLKHEREESASDLRDRLSSFAANLRDTVGEELAEFATARMKMARREHSARRAHVRDLRRRVGALLASSDKLVEGLNQDRERAGRTWEQHLRAASRQRRAATRAAAENETTSRRSTARKTTKRQKHART